MTSKSRPSGAKNRHHVMTRQRPQQPRRNQGLVRDRSSAGIELALYEVALAVTAHDQALISEGSQRLLRR